MRLLHLLDVALRQQFAAAEHEHVVAHRLDVRQQVAGEEQAHPLAVRQVAGQLDHLLAAGRVHAVRRLVEDQQLRVVDDRRGELQPLLHAGGVRLDRAVARLVEADVVEHLVGALHGVGAAPCRTVRRRRRRSRRRAPPGRGTRPRA